MNWIDNAYSMIFATSVMLGVIHFFIWLKQRHQLGHLLFSVIAMSAGALAIMEMLMARAPTPEYFATLLRWSQIPLTTFTLGSLGLVRAELPIGKYWLLAVGAALRIAALVLNFSVGDSLQYLEVNHLVQLHTWFGQEVAAPGGERNPLIAVGQLSNFFILWYMMDVLVSARHHPDAAIRRKVLLICGSFTLCIVTASLFMVGMLAGVLHVPIILSPTFFQVILVMSYMLGGDVVNALGLSRKLLSSQKSLRDSEQRMEQTTTAANIGLWTWNLDDDVSWFSDIGAQLLGIPPGTQLSRDAFLQLVHPEDREAILHARHWAVDSGGEYSIEYRMPQADGRLRWFSAKGRAERESPDAPLFLRGVLVDITERHQAEERLKLVVDGSPIGKLVCNADGNIALVNLRTEQIFGYPSGELLGQSIDTLLPHGLREDKAGHRSPFLKELAPNPRGKGRELSGLRKDGGEVLLEIHLTYMEMDEAPKVLLSIIDVTERKRMEQESALQREELAHLSRVTLLGELSGSLAHELNQPLTAVLSNAQAALRFLAHDPPNLDEVRESLVHIVENDKRASEVIRRLRAMLRKELLDYQSLDINEVVQDVLRLINSDLLNRRIHVILDLAADLPAINGDRVQLQQVLLNLVINACDAMRDISDERTLTVRSRLVPGPGIEVSISDVGHGIATGELERIFEPFITSKAEGIGLGLPICRTIIQAHQGTLWASNNDANGSTLHFTLPFDPGPSGQG